MQRVASLVHQMLSKRLESLNRCLFPFLWEISSVNFFENIGHTTVLCSLIAQPKFGRALTLLPEKWWYNSTNELKSPLLVCWSVFVSFPLIWTGGLASFCKTDTWEERMELIHMPKWGLWDCGKVWETRGKIYGHEYLFACVTLASSLHDLLKTLDRQWKTKVLRN